MKTRTWESVLIMYVGPMWGEKSTNLVREASRAKRAQCKIDVFVPATDTRSKGQVRTHTGVDLSTIGITPKIVNSSKDMWVHRKKDAELHILDEVHLWDDELPIYVEKLLALGKGVVCAGLDMDSEGNPIGPVPTLLCRAQKIVKCTAICSCGAEADRTLAIVPKTGQVLVGAGEFYVPKCFACWSLAMKHRKLKAAGVLKGHRA